MDPISSSIPPIRPTGPHAASADAALRQTLQRLGQGLSVRAQGAGLDAPASRSPIFTPSAEDQALDRMGRLLDDLEMTIAKAKRDGGEGVGAGLQAEVDGILGQIQQLTEATTTFTHPIRPLPYTVSHVSPNVEDLSIGFASLPPGEQLQVNVNVIASARIAMQMMSFGGQTLSIQEEGTSFEFELAGKLGTATFSFASGTSMQSIANAINAKTETTGIHALRTFNSVILRTAETGSDEFVSVRVIDDAGITGPNTGLYGFVQGGWHQPIDPSTHVSFGDASEPVVRYGQDVSALVNGVLAEGRGRTITHRSSEVWFTMTLRAGWHGGAQTLGQFSAFVISGTSASATPGDPITGASSENAQLREAIESVRTGVQEGVHAGEIGPEIQEHLDALRRLIVRTMGSGSAARADQDAALRAAMEARAILASGQGRSEALSPDALNRNSLDFTQ